MFNLPTTNFNHFQELLNDWKAKLVENPDGPDDLWQYVTPPIGALVLPKLTGDCFFYDYDFHPHNEEAELFVTGLVNCDYPCELDGEYCGLHYSHYLHVYDMSLINDGYDQPYTYEGHPVTKVLQLTYNVSKTQGLDMYFIFTK